MAIASTILPILSVSKISLKDIILNSRPHKHRKYLKQTVAGGLLIILGLVLGKSFEGNLRILRAIGGIIMVTIGVIQVLPIIVLVGSKVLEIIFRVFFGNIGGLANKNIKKNKSVLNSITLITIGISILFGISTMTASISRQIVNFYGDTFSCDLMGYTGSCNERIIRKVKQNESVERVIEVMRVDSKVVEFDGNEIYPEAIQCTELQPDIDYNIEGDEQSLLKELQDGRNIIISEFLKNKYHLKVGDTLTFKFKKASRNYKVIGFMNTMWQNGRFALMPIKYVKQDAEKKYYDRFYISLKGGANVEEVVGKLSESIGRMTYIGLRTIDEIAKSDAESTGALMQMISIFAILAMVIGIVGVINNLMISFIERKQSIAMMRSVGMSKWQVLKMIFVEGLGSGLISATCGLGGGIIICYALDSILVAMEQVVRMEIHTELFAPYFIGGMLITVMGSIIPARGSSKLNIIEAIKYE